MHPAHLYIGGSSCFLSYNYVNGYQCQEALVLRAHDFHLRLINSSVI